MVRILFFLISFLAGLYVYFDLGKLRVNKTTRLILAMLAGSFPVVLLVYFIAKPFLIRLLNLGTESGSISNGYFILCSKCGTKNSGASKQCKSCKTNISLDS